MTKVGSGWHRLGAVFLKAVPPMEVILKVRTLRSVLSVGHTVGQDLLMKELSQVA